MDYFFPDFDLTTRLVMLDELSKDLENGLFYEPESMTCFGVLDVNTYELLKKSLKESLKEQTEHHKTELDRINNEIEKLQKRLVKIYSDKMDEIIDTEIWLALKSEWLLLFTITQLIKNYLKNC